MLSDRRYPCFRNFNSAVSIDVIRMKSYVDSLFDPACVSVGVTIDKLDLTISGCDRKCSKWFAGFERFRRNSQMDHSKLLRARNDGKVEWNTTRCILPVTYRRESHEMDESCKLIG